MEQQRNEQSLTVKQLADRLGVSKTAIRKRFTEEFRAEHVQDVDGLLLIDEDGCKLIAETLKTSAHSIPKAPETNTNRILETMETVMETAETDTIALMKSTIDLLQTMLEAKDRQLEAKDRQLEALNTALDNSQQIQQQLTASLTKTQDALTAAQALHAGTLQTIAVGASDSPLETPQADGGIPVPPTPEEANSIAPDNRESLFKKLFRFGKKNKDGV